MFLFDTYWTEVLRDLLPWASTLFKTASFLGSEYFFIAVIAITYWTIDKQASKRAVILLLFSSATNYWLKITLQSPRPPQSNWLPDTSASNYSLPSGHTQNSATIWGWLGLKSKDNLRRIIYIMIILLVSFSRIYIGVHWLGDIILGWLISVITLGLYQIYEKRINTLIESESFYFGLVVFGLVSLIVTELLSPVLLLDNFGAIGGLMIGIGAGFLLEDRYLKFEISQGHPLVKSLVKVVFGLSLVFLAMIGLSSVFVSEIYWLRAIRYTLVAITALFIWPYIFTKVKL